MRRGVGIARDVKTGSSTTWCIFSPYRAGVAIKDLIWIRCGGRKGDRRAQAPSPFRIVSMLVSSSHPVTVESILGLLGSVTVMTHL